MEKYVEGFRLLDLGTTTPVTYKGPEKFALGFHKAAVLREDSVRYSSNSASTKAPALAVVHCK